MLSLLTRENIKALVPIINSTYGLMSGRSSSFAIEGLYAALKNRVEKPTDPITDGCGYYWFSPVVPCQTAALNLALNAYQTIFERWGFDFALTLQLPSERAVFMVLSIGYDKQDEHASVKAKRCYEDLIEESKQLGLLPYRTGNASTQKFITGGDPFWTLIRNIKRAVDPNNILAPGKWST